jgi:RimJ/RimL family protein N-acetyltransferase
MLDRVHAAHHARVVIETHPNNHASRRGIEAAGFRYLRRLDLAIVANTVVIANVEEAGRQYRRVWIL